eukprot:5817105-Pyramimonas_sp.AAC.1
MLLQRDDARHHRRAPALGAEAVAAALAVDVLVREVLQVRQQLRVVTPSRRNHPQEGRLRGREKKK